MEQKMQNTKEKKHEERIVRILSKDIEGGMKVYAGLTKVKGISWAFANAICKKLGIDKNRKIGSLTEEDVKKISEFVKNPQLPIYLMNRRKDFESGENKHMTSSDLELRTDFDIKRLKKIKCYRGIRHVAGLPVRGQRTKSHFKHHRKRGVGIKVKAKGIEKKEK
jgi:small subunit ribosomal protein S13